MTQAATLYLGRLPHLGELFERFNAGKHLNRVAEPALWAELEKEQEQYQTLFASLGFDLRVDGRGFAWFHFDNASSNVSRTTRQLALLFMLLFELKADEGTYLERFSDWRIDRGLLAMLMERGHDLLQAEGLDEESLASLLDRACTHGFAESIAGGWRLLPAVWRYLDHFEALASQQTGDMDDSAEIDTRDEATEEDEAS
ncbi:hypothetical protein D3C84_533390 [compost metagenome]